MININAEAIKARCVFVMNSTSSKQYVDLTKADEFVGVTYLSYEAALVVWDMARWPSNRIYIRRPSDWEHYEFDFRFTISRRVVQVLGPKTRGQWPAKSKWIGWQLFLKKEDFIDPYTIHSKLTAREYLAAILDELINRPEPLRVHDLKRFKWVDRGRLIEIFER